MKKDGRAQNGVEGKSEEEIKKGESGAKPEANPDTNKREVPTKNDHSAVKKGEREGVPSNILEKGIIYFFFRGRVGIDEPGSVDEIRRSYIVLRPIEKDAKLSEGTIGDAGNSRLIAIPK